MMLRADEKYRVDVADCRSWLPSLPAGSVHACITSPPYFGLRDYGTAEWEGGDPQCDHSASKPTRKAKAVASSGLEGSKETVHANQIYARVCGRCGARRVDRQIGLEQTPAEYVAEMVGVFREVRRVLRDDGTLWLNLGDSYNNFRIGQVGQSVHNHEPRGKPTKRRRGVRGLKEKDLLGIPWQVAFALRDDGWYLRSDCIWFKRNVMPESVKDRPSKAHEYVFMLTKTGRSYFDMEAVKERAVYAKTKRQSKKRGEFNGKTEAMPGRNAFRAFVERRHLRTVWDIPTAPHKAAHFAVMAPRLALRCLLASTSEEGVCPHCGAPWRRVIERDRKPTRPGTDTKVAEPNGSKQDAVGKRTYTGFNARWKAAQVGNRDPQRHVTETRTVGWKAGCECEANTPTPAIVIDPFAGAGTTLYVATKYGRRGLGCELNPEYAAIARKRLDRLGANLFD